VVVPSPSWPLELYPQHHRVPLVLTAQVSAKATVTEAQSLAWVLSCTGTALPVVVPSPNWPLELDPQHHRVPAVLTAQVWAQRTLTEAQSLAWVLSCTGTALPVVVPSPSWPELLDPQHHRVPAVLIAQVCRKRALTAAQSLAWVLSCTGTALPVVVPS